MIILNWKHSLSQQFCSVSPLLSLLFCLKQHQAGQYQFPKCSTDFKQKNAMDGKSITSIIRRTGCVWGSVPVCLCLYYVFTINLRTGKASPLCSHSKREWISQHTWLRVCVTTQCNLWRTSKRAEYAKVKVRAQFRTQGEWNQSWLDTKNLVLCDDFILLGKIFNVCT